MQTPQYKRILLEINILALILMSSETYAMW